MTEPSPDDLDDRLRAALGYVRPAWSRARADRVKLLVEKRAGNPARSPLAFAVVSSAVGVALGIACLVLMRPPAPSTPHAHESKVEHAAGRAIAARARASRVHAFGDGSFAELMGSGTSEVQLLEAGPHRMVVKLHGSAVFDVAEDRARTFVVRWDGISIEVLGTRFRLETDGSVQHRVFVEEGTVKVVAGQGNEIVLVAGQVRMFAAVPNEGATPKPPASQIVSPAIAPADAVAMTPGIVKKRRARAPNPETSSMRSSRDVGVDIRRRSLSDWRRLGRSGQYDAAYAAFVEQDDPNALRTAEERLLFADIARFSGHPSAAVSALLPLAQDDSDLPEASVALASFTLGRIYLEDLERPEEAAVAFHRVRVLVASTVLAEVALVREIEALAKSGRLDEARRQAEVFLALYPESLHKGEVLRFAVSEESVTP